MPQKLTDDQLQALKAAGTKYRRELLAMPLALLQPVLAHMTMRANVRGKEVVGEISEGAEIRPYRSAKDAVEGIPEITLRELETFLGDVVREFDPNMLLGTLFTDRAATPLTDREIARKMAFLMAQSVSNKFYKAIWSAKRNASGSTTMDLFDGFATIIDKEITDKNITSDKGNFADLGSVNEANVGDKLMEAYNDAVSEELQSESRIKLFVPRLIYNQYNKWYLAEFGSVAYNKEFKKTFLEGTDDTVELVPMTGLKDTGKIIFTVRNNMLVGCDQMSDMEQVEIRRPDNPKALQFFMMLYFGVQLESISPQRLLVGQFTTTTGE
ncbi:hypothetical protein [uncultured Rikenella sp.]|uniref:hypothetical protein n=1 Tax=uncultured Rikenella sp. TaxID=368003 RepID=UPI0026223A21|nr:hypothetical protein [uncultured Rikenella sp.]